MKVLIVDDHEDMAASIQAALENCECKLAFSAKQGSEILALERFDIVITDINMPNGGGERIIVEAKTKYNSSIYVYTGTEKADEIYQKLGAKAVFRKPYIVDLVEAVEKELESLNS